MNSDFALPQLVAQLPEVYQPIFGHPQLSTGLSRPSFDRLDVINQVYDLFSRKLQRPLRVLDLGCAQGFFSLSLAEKGAEMFGIDSREANIAVCNALAQEHAGFKLNFRHLGLEEFLPQIVPGQFDLCLGLSVFHHVSQAHGFAVARQLVTLLAARIDVGVYELALASEPLPWAASLPSDELTLLAGYAFVRPLATVPTHLSAVMRPLVAASSSYWFLGNHCGHIEHASVESHQLSGGTHLHSRKYFRGEGQFVKFFSFSGERGELNQRELTNEVEFLSHVPKGVRVVPKLYGWGIESTYGWVRRAEFRGDLLSTILHEQGAYNPKHVILDVLGFLAALEGSGLYHNDIRVWNTFILEDGSATLIDYGAISPDPNDCVSHEPGLYSFPVYTEEVATGQIRPNPLLRFPYSNPSSLPGELGAWAQEIWKHPVASWSYGIFLQSLRKANVQSDLAKSTSVEHVRERNFEHFVTLYENRLLEFSKRATRAEDDRKTLQTLAAQQQIDLGNISSQNEQLTHLVKSFEAESNSRQSQIDQLTHDLHTAQDEAEARFTQIQKLNEILAAHDSESAHRAVQVEKLTALAKQHENDSAARLVQIEELSALSKKYNADSIARFSQIEELTQLAKRHESDAMSRWAQVQELTALSQKHEAESADRNNQIQILTGELTIAQADASARLFQVEELTEIVKKLNGVLQEREAEMAKLDADVRNLNEYPNSRDHSGSLDTALRQANRERTLANRLLAATPLLKRNPQNWVPIPLTSYEHQTSELRFTIEVARRDLDMACVSGWAFPEGKEDAVRVGPPTLVAIGTSFAWAVAGLTVERSDVLQAFPAAGSAAILRLQSGFAFELATDQLPEGVLEWRVLLGIVGIPPLVTSAFQLS